MANPWDSDPIYKPLAKASTPAANPWDNDPVFSEPAAPKVAASAPKVESSFLGNVAAGVGKGVTDIGLGVKQRYLELANAMGGKRESLDPQLLGTTAPQVLASTNADVVEKRRVDAPLMATTGGKVGNFVGKAIPAVVAAFLPGGQTLTGSIVAGGLLGGAEPTVEGESAGRNALTGAVGGGVGYGVGKGIVAGVNRLAAGREASAVANSVKDATAASAREAGYVIPPVQTNPNMLNRTLEGLSGKISTGQSASIKNQKVTNELAAKALGLDPAQPITQEALSGLRSEAGQAYSAIKGAGTITADAEYSKALSGITAKFQGASKDFPELAKNDIEAIVSSIDKPSFSADSAVNAIKILREKADKAFGSGDKGTGKAFREASDAMENVIERNLQSMGPEAQGMLQEFRNARQLIAKTYTVEKALNGSTGNVAARKLASQLARGKPLSGELKDIGQFAQAFPKAADEVTSSMPGVSPLDFFGAGSISAATGNPLGMLAAAVRPISRATILSKPYQNALGAASYSGNPLLNLLASQPGRVMLQAGGALSPQFTKKDRP